MPSEFSLERKKISVQLAISNIEAAPEGHTVCRMHVSTFSTFKRDIRNRESDVYIHIDHICAISQETTSVT